MEQREAVIRLWFDMWLKKADLGVAGVFTPEAVYIESWGPEPQFQGGPAAWF